MNAAVDVFAEERRNIHEELGAAALAWNYVEAALAELYCAALGCPTSQNPFYRSVVATFYAIVSFEAKIKATDAALTYTIFGNGSVQDDWTKLRNKINRSRKTRNNLAHYTLVGFDQKKTGEKILASTRTAQPSWVAGFYIRRKTAA